MMATIGWRSDRTISGGTAYAAQHDDRHDHSGRPWDSIDERDHYFDDGVTVADTNTDRCVALSAI